MNSVYMPYSLVAFVQSLRPEEWEWGPIGDNALAYHNWAREIARQTGRSYNDVFDAYRSEVYKLWKGAIAEDA